MREINSRINSWARKRKTIFGIKTLWDIFFEIHGIFDVIKWEGANGTEEFRLCTSPNLGLKTFITKYPILFIYLYFRIHSAHPVSPKFFDH